MQPARRFTYTIVGDGGVGKTCLERQFTARTFPEVHDLTIGVEFSTRTINVDDKRIQLHICDTAGHEAFVPITKQFYCTAACIILVYDITRRETFDHIATLLERARELSRAGITLALIGNKCDLSHMRAVSHEEGREFAKRHDLVFMEASAKTTHNVDEAFILIAERIYKKVQDGVLDLPEKVSLSACLAQYAGKAKDWLSIGWQPSYFASLSKLGNLWQALESPNLGMPICWIANFWHKMGQWK
ncbi:hypothetical protein ACQJBY_018461 [Aegilops geniculata]